MPAAYLTAEEQHTRRRDVLEITPTEFDRLQFMSRMDTFRLPDWNKIFAYRTDGKLDDQGTYSRFQRALFLCDVVKGVVLISGQPGAGKTTVMTMLCKRLELYFGMRTVFDFVPRPKYGEYTYFDEDVLAEELDSVTEMVQVAKARYKDKPEEDKKYKLQWKNKEVQDELETRLGSLLHGKTMGLDEAYKYLDKFRRTRMSLYLGDMIKQWRHWDILMALIFPDDREANKQLVEPYLTHEVMVSESLAHQGWSDCLIHNRRTGEDRNMHVYGPHWQDLFDSWNPITARSQKKFKLQV